MRWEWLFADLESQLDAAVAQGLGDQVAELTRAERAAVVLSDRLRAHSGRHVEVLLRGGDRLAGSVADVGQAWFLLADAPREHLVVLDGVVALGGLATGAAPPDGVALRRLGLGHALRAIARDRALVVVVAGPAVLRGRVDVVAADHLDLALAAPDSGRPTGVLQAIPFGALERVTSA